MKLELTVAGALVGILYAFTAERTHAAPTSVPKLSSANSAVAARVVRAESGFEMKFEQDGRETIRRIEFPKALWHRMSAQFHPDHADVVVTPGGEIASVALAESRTKVGRELWITLSHAGEHCQAMVYPSGGRFAELAVDPSLSCKILR